MLLNKIALSLLAIILMKIVLYAELIDMGVHGETFSINEVNFMDTVEQKINDINKTKIKKEYIDSSNEFLEISKLVPVCHTTRTREFTPTFVVPTDIKKADGTYLAREGDVLNTLEVMKQQNITLDKYLMFIDVNDELQVQLAYMYKNQGLVYVTNGSLKDFEERTKIASSKADKSILKKFDIKCSPTLTVQDGNTMKIYEYNINDLKKKY